MITNDVFPQQDSSTSDATLHAVDDDEYISERDALDSSDILASLLETATVALNTDRRVAQKCIRRSAALLGIDLSPRGDATAERSHLRGGLAPWQARRLRSYIEDKPDSTIRAGDLAGLVRLSTSYVFLAFRNTFGETPVAYIMKRRMLRAQELMLKSRLSLSQVALECVLCAIRLISHALFVGSSEPIPRSGGVNYFCVLHSVRTHPDQPGALRLILRPTVVTPLLSSRR